MRPGLKAPPSLRFGVRCVLLAEQATPSSEENLGWWKEIAEEPSENEIKPLDWLVPVS